MNKPLVALAGLAAFASVSVIPGCFSSSSSPDGPDLVFDTTWTYSSTVTVSLSDSAAAADTLANYPLLVRLGSASAAAGGDVLAGAHANGSDVRFFTADGSTALPHEIESWSSTQAAVWVRVPKVAANGQTALRITWGDIADPGTASNAAAVFDTANGFEAVFHLHQAAGDSIRDATANGFKGVAVGTITPTEATGSASLIGGSKNFNGDSANINAGGGYRLVTASGGATNASFDYFGATAVFTVSAWVNVNAFPAVNTNRRGIVTKADSGNGQVNANIQWHLRTVNNSNGAFSFLRTSVDPSTGGNQVVRPDAAGVWTYVAYSATGLLNALRVYNELAAASASAPANVAGVHTESSVFIGAFAGAGGGGTQFFNGRIDEVRLSKVARSAAWHNTDFATQRPGASAVTLGATQSVSVVDTLQP